MWNSTPLLTDKTQDFFDLTALASALTTTRLMQWSRRTRKCWIRELRTWDSASRLTDVQCRSVRPCRCLLQSASRRIFSAGYRTPNGLQSMVRFVCHQLVEDMSLGAIFFSATKACTNTLYRALNWLTEVKMRHERISRPPPKASPLSDLPDWLRASLPLVQHLILLTKNKRWNYLVKSPAAALT